MKKILTVLIAVLLVSGFAFTVSASENTTYTYTLSVDNKWVRTQDAYNPSAVYLKNAGMLSPSDMFIKDKYLYVSDTGNARIICMNIITEKIDSVIDGFFESPKGIFVTDDDVIFVADSGKKEVMAIKDGRKILSIQKPESKLFAYNSDFIPQNVVVSSEGNIFVCGENTAEGLMKFGKDGSFQGYFAANKYKATLKDTIEDLIFSEAQKNNSVSRSPRPITNIDITENDLVYSITQGEIMSLSISNLGSKTENMVKLHNYGGTDILSPNHGMVDEWNFVDIASASDGRSYAVTYTGLIYEYDSDGNLIFSFGGRSIENDRIGQFAKAAAIDTDDNGFIYVLDIERSLIQVFAPTEFAELTHDAVISLQNGNYDESGELWQVLLRANARSKIAHIGYGKTLFHEQKFSEALNHFKIANDKEFYSECFWEMRNEWLNNHIIYFLFAVIIFILYRLFATKLLKKKKKSARENRLKQRLAELKTILLHPVDNVYDIKTGRIGSWFSATLLYINAFVVYIFDTTMRGFLFKLINVKNTSVMTVIVPFVVILSLWILGAFLIGSINSGEAKLKVVYTVTAYSFLPYVLFTPVITALSYVLTLNEAFIIQYGWTAIVIWTGVSIFLCIKEAQNYTMKMSVRNVFITLLFIVMVIVAFLLLIVLGSSFIHFLKIVFNEVVYRAWN